MAVLQRVETTTGPVALGGRTITLVARTTAIRIGEERAVVHVRSRPIHVEVLDEAGRLHVVRVHDVEHTLVTAIAIGVAGTFVRRIVRNILANRRSSA